MEALAHFHFRLDEMTISSELLGASHVVERAGRRVHFSFPANETDFGLERVTDERAFAGGVQREGEWVSRTLGLVRLSVELQLPDAAAEEHPDRATIDEVLELVRSAAEVARGCLHDYVDLVRTHYGQYWLAHSGQIPRMAWLTSVVDMGSGERLRYGYSDPLKVHVHLGSELSANAHTDALQGVEKGQTAGVPELLLADAMYLAEISDARQYREATIMAAVAAEVRIKEVLDLVCPDASRSILDFALNNPRDVSVQAAALYDKAAEAVTGRSLRKENRQLYKSLSGLFEHRNAVAHRAFAVEKSQVAADVAAARDALQWADSLIGA